MREICKIIRFEKPVRKLNVYACHMSMIVQPGRKIREDRLLISIAFGKEEMGKEKKRGR